MDGKRDIRFAFVNSQTSTGAKLMRFHWGDRSQQVGMWQGFRIAGVALGYNLTGHAGPLLGAGTWQSKSLQVKWPARRSA